VVLLVRLVTEVATVKRVGAISSVRVIERSKKARRRITFR